MSDLLSALQQQNPESKYLEDTYGQYFEADKELRAALPLIQGNTAMTAPALFYLGMANYDLGRRTMSKARVPEAAKFSEQAAAIKGP